MQIGTMFLYRQWKVNEKIYRFLILLRVFMLTTLSLIASQSELFCVCKYKRVPFSFMLKILYEPLC